MQNFSMRRGVVGLLAGCCLGLSGCQAQPRGSVEMFPPPPVGALGSGGGAVFSDPSGAPPFAPPVGAQPLFEQPAAVPGGVGAGGTGAYTVQKGDTLWSVAAKVYGDGQRHRELLAANPGVDPQRLLVGQTLRVP